MKIKTSELTGRALDWAVARAIGATEEIMPSGNTWLKPNDDWYVSNRDTYNFEPSTDWEQCGELIDKYLDDVTYMGRKDNHWVASVRALTVDDFSIFKTQTGDTPQIAICRAVVAAQLGDEVDIPDELVEDEG
ncbi:DUF2591 domain-containing protein [Xenorhabdus bovienii]|uniref:DUF2591 domain-containing protein n=1 Tax=Xenorhabdus bovienii TaxID=40576 RepID=UPI002157AEF6|nr:DUF2591 domain-containing protein [Xenorhabdus bovienii]